jgi:lipopolysaccharide/colanic/teichoic acid biosynthesis glycosyltransferase
MKMALNSSTVAAPETTIQGVETDSKTKTVVLRICKRNSLVHKTGTDYIEFLSENYLSARTQLNWFVESNAPLPDLILIDLPFIKRDVRNFSDWLTKSTEFSGIPLVYSKTFLGSSELSELLSEPLVDDIVDLDKNIGVLSAKAKFLNSLKNYQPESSSRMDFVSVKKSAKSGLKEISRRSLDIIISLFLIILLLPVLVIIAIVVKLESKGPIFYISKRAGRGYKIFNFYKFRTMHIGADNQREELEKLNLYSLKNSSARFFKIKNDPRITRVGAFLRNTSLDELPQLFNVLKGDMSIVGNRPLPLYEAATLTTNEWAERFMAPAGITGLWQIKKRGREKMSVEERINLDIDYAKNNDLLKDLVIIAKTPAALFQKTNV